MIFYGTPDVTVKDPVGDIKVYDNAVIEARNRNSEYSSTQGEVQTFSTVVPLRLSRCRGEVEAFTNWFKANAGGYILVHLFGVDYNGYTEESVLSLQTTGDISTTTLTLRLWSV